MRLLALSLCLLLGGCATSGVTLPHLPAWRAVDAPILSAGYVVGEVLARYPGIPVHTADVNYATVSRAWLDEYLAWTWQAAKAAGVEYTPESFDCDDFSLGFYFFATRARAKAKLSAKAAPLIARIVVPVDGGLHELVGVATDRGLVIVEPQPDAGPFRVTPLEQFPQPILSVTLGDTNPFVR